MQDFIQLCDSIAKVIRTICGSLNTAKICTKNYNARTRPLLCFLFCDVPVVVVAFLNSLLNLLAAVYFSVRSFAVYLGMTFCFFLGIISECSLKLQAINFTLHQELYDLREKLNKLQYQQPVSEAELLEKASENKQIKANVENCEGKYLVCKVF